MKQFSLSLLFLLGFHCMAFSQDFASLIEEGNYVEVVALGKEKNPLSASDVFNMGFAYYMLDNEKEAIGYFEKSMQMGYAPEAPIYYLGRSYRILERHEDALEQFRKLIAMDSTNQQGYSEIGNTFYTMEKLDSALIYFQKACNLEYKDGRPYFMYAQTYHMLRDLDKTLEICYQSLGIVPEDDYYYSEILSKIGVLEFTYTQDYPKSARAYELVIALDSSNYDVYSKLSKAYYASGEFDKAETLFDAMKRDYENNHLPELFQESGMLGIAEFYWNDQTALVFRNFNDPKETLDILYYIYLLSPDGESIERRLMTEKTIQLSDDGPQNLLCEREANGVHHTYLYGWSSNDIDYESLKNACIKVFEEELKPEASSSFGTGTTKKTKEKKRKNKKKD